MSHQGFVVEGKITRYVHTFHALCRSEEKLYQNTHNDYKKTKESNEGRCKHRRTERSRARVRQSLLHLPSAIIHLNKTGASPCRLLVTLVEVGNSQTVVCAAAGCRAELIVMSVVILRLLKYQEATRRLFYPERSVGIEAH